MPTTIHRAGSFLVYAIGRLFAVADRKGIVLATYLTEPEARAYADACARASIV